MRYSYSAFNQLSSVPVDEAGNCVSSFDGVKPCAAGAKMHRALSSYDKTEQSVILMTGETWHMIIKELSDVFVSYV